MSIDSALILQTILGVLLGAVTVAWLLRPRQRNLLCGLWVLALAAVLAPRVLLDQPGAEAARHIRVLSVLDEETTNSLVAAFTRDTGIVCDVDPFAGGTQTTVQLMLQGRLQPDVFLGGTVEIHEELATAGLLEACNLPPDPERIAVYDDPESRWVPLYLGYLALVYRPLPVFQAHPPDWNTLIEPRWKGRVSIPSPATSGGGLVFLATQILRQSDPGLAWEYLQLLNERETRFETSSYVPITRVAVGTMDLGVAWAHDILRRVERDRLPVELRIPERTGYEVGGASILRWTHDADAAREFVRFLTGPKAGEIQVSRGYRVPLRSDVDPPMYLNGGRLADEATAFYDRAAVLRHRADWITRWEELHLAEP